MIHDDELFDLMGEGEATISRASHVEPDEQGQWWADLSPVVSGVKLGPYPLRRDALEAEANWLRRNLL